MSVVWLDTETTGLDTDRHEIWELAIILDALPGQEWEFHLPVDLSRADPTGLRICRFYERRYAIAPHIPVANLCRWRNAAETEWVISTPAECAEIVARLLDGEHMVGAVPSFDAAFLTRWLRANGHAPTWHYHLADVENLAAGKLGVQPPWDSDDLTRRLGLEVDEAGRHTAIGDARWAKLMYEAVFGLGKEA
jgi:hypothetical protein